MQVFLRLSLMHQGLKTVQGKSEMLPLYQDKKEHVFRFAQKTKINTKKAPFRVLFIFPFHDPAHDVAHACVTAQNGLVALSPILYLQNPSHAS